MSQTQYPCANCGANVEFAPGTTVLKCPYCGAETQLAPTGRQIQEHSYAQFAGLPRKPIATLAPHVFTCKGCGAVTESDKISDRCQFCGAPLVADVGAGDMVLPEAVLPFGVDRPALRDALKGWTSSRWFAPNGLKKVTSAESSHSTYLPHWTYDARTVSNYWGERGEHYWETETYTEDGEAGRESLLGCEPIQRGEQLAPGQITRCAEDDDRRRAGRRLDAQAVPKRVHIHGSSHPTFSMRDMSRSHSARRPIGAFRTTASPPWDSPTLDRR